MKVRIILKNNHDISGTLGMAGTPDYTQPDHATSFGACSMFLKHVEMKIHFSDIRK